MLFIITELPDRRALYRALAELNAADAAGMPVGWKRVQGAPGWWERHLKTGHHHSGRLHARLGAERRGWTVLASSKADQPCDIRRLAKLGKGWP